MKKLVCLILFLLMGCSMQGEYSDSKPSLQAEQIQKVTVIAEKEDSSSLNLLPSEDDLQLLSIMFNNLEEVKEEHPEAEYPQIILTLKFGETIHLSPTSQGNLWIQWKNKKNEEKRSYIGKNEELFKLIQSFGHLK